MSTCDQLCVLILSKDNAPTQVVVAGSDEVLARAAEVARSRGGRAVRLGITGPFHIPAMAPAILKLRDVLDHIFIRSPRMPVVSNVSAEAYRAPGEIRRLLIEQLVARDRFREALYWLWDRGARDFVDFGPGHIAGKLAAQRSSKDRFRVRTFLMSASARRSSRLDSRL